MKSPRSRIRMRAGLSASAWAIVPPPAPLPIIMMSYRSFRIDSVRRTRLDAPLGVDLIHEPLILEGALEAHLRRSVLSNRAQEITIHRPIPTNITESRHEHPRHPAAPDTDERAVRFELD